LSGDRNWCECNCTQYLEIVDVEVCQEAVEIWRYGNDWGKR